MARVTHAASGRAACTPRQSVPRATQYALSLNCAGIQGDMVKQGPLPQDNCERNSVQQTIGSASPGPGEAFPSLAYSDGWDKNSFDLTIAQESGVFSPKSSFTVGPPQISGIRYKAWAPLIGASPLSMTGNNQISQNYSLENQGPLAPLKTVKVIKTKESQRHCHRQEESKDT